MIINDHLIGGIDMSEIISGQELTDSIKDKILIENGNVDSCEGLKYDFHLGGNILKSCFKRPVVFENLTQEDQNKCVIEPGEVVFVMTDERLNLPSNVYCQLSNKRKIGHGGIILLGGLIVDPNYKGHLIFGLYNISSQPYVLRPHRKLIAGVFYKTENAFEDLPTPAPVDEFPDELINMIRNYEPFSPLDVTGDVRLIRMELDEIKKKLNDDDTWRKDFKEGLSEISKKLDQLTEDLNKERMVRQSGDQDLNSKFNFVRGVGLVLGTLVGGGIVSLLVMWIAGVFKIG